MPFDFSKYETVASELSQNPTEENIRAAISRAYYCLYHRAKRLVSRRELDKISTDTAHKKIIEAIRANTEINNHLVIAKNMDDLKQDRVYSDYFSTTPPSVVFNKHSFQKFWLKYTKTIQLIEEAYD